MTVTVGRQLGNAPLSGPTVDQVLLLQAVRGYPTVTLLMNTRPAPRMVSGDAAALRALAKDAIDRVCRASEGDEQATQEAAALRVALDGLVGEAVAGRTGTAIGVFASLDVAELVTLPITVRDRAVVDGTFATRDLVRALHRTPRHVVLVFNSGQARLFDGGAGVLRPAATDAFPLYSDTAGKSTESVNPAFLRRVDTALGVYLRLRPAPLILVGPDRVLSAFKSVSSNTKRLAGTISGNLAKALLSELAHRLQPVLDQYLHSRQAEALQHLAHADRAGRVVTGVPAAWLAARHERPEMLAVEEGLFYPARLSDDGDYLTATDDVGSPDVVDDIVDELIELALSRGAWIALTEDGALTGYDRVALTVRPRR